MEAPTRIPIYGKDERGRSVIRAYAKVDQCDSSMIFYKWHYSSDGYAKRQILRGGVKTTIRMHQQIMGAPPPGMQIDHMNRVRVDNRRSNLRFVSPAENHKNRGPPNRIPGDTTIRSASCG